VGVSGNGVRAFATAGVADALQADNIKERSKPVPSNIEGRRDIIFFIHTPSQKLKVKDQTLNF
jgi:hypothetical protein